MDHTDYQAAPTIEDRAAETVSEAATAAGAAVRDATNQIRGAASDVGARVSHSAEDVLNDLAKHVVQQPLSAILMAGGVGLIAGLLLTRR